MSRVTLPQKDWMIMYYDKDDRMVQSHTILNRSYLEVDRIAGKDIPASATCWSIVAIDEPVRLCIKPGRA